MLIYQYNFSLLYLDTPLCSELAANRDFSLSKMLPVRLRSKKLLVSSKMLLARLVSKSELLPPCRLLAMAEVSESKSEPLPPASLLLPESTRRVEWNGAEEEEVGVSRRSRLFSSSQLEGFSTYRDNIFKILQRNLKFNI